MILTHTIILISTRVHIPCIPPGGFALESRQQLVFLPFMIIIILFLTFVLCNSTENRVTKTLHFFEINIGLTPMFTQMNETIVTVLKE